MKVEHHSLSILQSSEKNFGEPLKRQILYRKAEKITAFGAFEAFSKVGWIPRSFHEIVC